jgi:hypothetical protein
MAAAAVTAWIGQRASALATTDPAASLTELAPLRQLVGDAGVAGLGKPPMAPCAVRPQASDPPLEEVTATRLLPAKGDER